jgi:hypothetical protein
MLPPGVAVLVALLLAALSLEALDFVVVVAPRRALAVVLPVD